LAVLTLSVLMILLAVPATQAWEGRGGDVVVIEAGEVIEDDLYVAASEFTLDGTVKGDLIVVGRTLRINGTVEGDVAAAGQSIIIDGAVQDDARLAGYALTVGGQVADDLVTAGFSLEDKSESNVGGDLLFFGYQALLAGDITGDADLSGGAVQLAGNIGGDANVNVGDARPGEGAPPVLPFAPNMPPVPDVRAGLTLAEGARLGGDLNYTSAAPVDIPAGAVAGNTVFTQYVSEDEVEAKAPSAADLLATWFLDQLRRLVTLLLVGAFLMWLVPNWMRQLSGVVYARPLPSLGWGVVAVVAFAAFMVVLMIVTILLAIIFGVATLGGLAVRTALLGVISAISVAFGFSLVWSYITRIVISLLLGQLVFTLFKSPAAEHRWWPLLLGVLIFVIITAIPVLGWLAGLATLLLGLGAVWIWGRGWLASRKVATL
jgi:cytoskeletal protein CcmA (bactofilin family)